MSRLNLATSDTVIPPIHGFSYHAVHCGLKMRMENSRNKQLISLKACAVLSPLMEAHTGSRCVPERRVVSSSRPVPCTLPAHSHLAADLVITLTVVVSQSLCSSGSPYLTNNGPKAYSSEGKDIYPGHKTWKDRLTLVPCGTIAGDA